MELLVAAFEARGANAVPPTPPVPPSADIHVPFEDSSEADLDGVLVEEGVGTGVFIRYVDAGGAESRRRISIQDVYESDAGQWLIRAFCHERQAPRTFRADRIAEAVDVETGEVIDDPTEILSRFAFLGETLASTPEGAVREVLRRCRPGLNVLMFLARCDGRLHPREKEVVLHYMVEDCFDADFDGDVAIEKAVRMYPSFSTYQASIKRLGVGEERNLKRVAKYARQLIEADGVIDDSEFEFGMILEEAVREPA